MDKAPVFLFYVSRENTYAKTPDRSVEGFFVFSSRNT